MENEKKEESKQEIDLIEAFAVFFKWLWGCVVKLGHCLGWLVRLAFHEKVIVSIFLLLGVGAGLFLSWNKIYRGEVELRFHSHDAYFYKNIIDPLFDQCKYRDYDKLAADFDFTKDEVRKLARIQAYYYIDVLSDGTPNRIDYDETFNPSDTLDKIMDDRLRLVVESMDRSLFNKMDKAFAHFFSQNPQIIKENDLRMKQLDERVIAISNEVFMLDSLRKKEYFQRKRDVQLSTDKMLLVEREVKLYHNELLALEAEKQNAIWDRNMFDNGVTFSSAFEVNPHAVNGKVKMSVIFGIIGLMAGLLVAGVKVRRKDIADYLKRGL